MALAPQSILDAFQRMFVAVGGTSADLKAARDWLGSLTSEVDARVTPTLARVSVAQTGAFTLATSDKRATDDLAGTFSVAVPDAATLGDPWSYDGVITSGVVTFVGDSASVPVTASGGGTPVRLYVANGKVFLRSGSGATVTRVA
jgi:hypothetical protein